MISMIENDYIEMTEEKGLIVGLAGERLISSFKFYAVFKDSEDFTVRAGDVEKGTAEEIGTMGPMLCSDENAAKFMRTNLYSLWANNAAGAMWWCANDQTMLTKVPYTENMVELELGLLDKL